MKEIFGELKMTLHAVVALVQDPEVLIARITARRTCTACNAIVNLMVDKLPDERHCPFCGGPLAHRDDDNEITVRKRIEGYHFETEPLLEYYRENGVLHSVNGLGTVAEVGERINMAISGLVV